MQPKLIQSRFRGIYAALGIIFCALGVGLNFLSSAYVQPRILSSRLAEVQSVLNSHDSNIQLNLTRPVRDELLARGIIREDIDFELVRFGDPERIGGVLSECSFATANACVKGGRAVFLNRGASPERPAEISYLVELKTSYFQDFLVLHLWLWGLLAIIATAFYYLARVIRREELGLTQQVRLVLESLARVRELFLNGSENAQPETSKRTADEFQDMVGSLSELQTHLARTGLEIGDYKAAYERKTRLEQLGRTVGQVSHDLKAPLNEILMFLEAMPHYVKDEERPRAQESAESMRKTVDSALRIIDQALKKTSESACPMQVVSVGDFLELFRERLAKNPELSKLRAEVAAPAPVARAQVACDSPQLLGALVNLAQNSLDERPDARFVVEGKIDGAQLVLTVADDGPGIPMHRLERIFEPLVTYKVNGRGFGLAGARETIVRHGGSIRAKAFDGGALFEIRLPLHTSKLQTDRRPHGEAQA